VGIPGLILHSNAEAIRSKTIKAYKAQVTALRKANEKMRQFVEVDQPAFSLWWQHEFSDELLNQMELERTLGDLSLLADAIEQYREYHRISFQDAHAIVSKAHADGTLPALMRELFEAIDRGRETHRKTITETLDEEFFQALFDEFEQATGKTSQDPFDPPRSAPRPSESTTDAYLKKMYHDLVMKLHPDASKGEEQSPEARRLWHELQNAYQWRDLERMENIAKVVFGKGAAPIDFKTIPIGDIFAMKEALGRNLKDVNRELRQARQEITWDFENKRKKRQFLEALSESIEEELLEHTLLLEHRIEAVKNQLKSWSRPRRRRT